MEQHSLLRTKLYIPPVRPELVSRPRLIERLNAGLDRKLALISAPAGFGKTTLVSEWVHYVEAHSDAPPVAWLSLDEGDNDPARFLSYLIAAMRTIEASMAKGVLSALQSPRFADANTPPPSEEILTTLINEITTIPHRILLVLDDYHLINAQLIHDALTFLLEHLPPQMHMVIASREDPHLPLASLRVRSQLTEVRATDLRFSSSEAAEFLNQVKGLGLSAEDITALETRTEGWIAGLQLAALSMQGRKDTSSLIKSFTGSHRYVLDYLIKEVLEQQSESVQTFLLQTAILDRLTGPLCDAVRFDSVDTAGRSVRAATPEGDAVRLGPAESPNRSGGAASSFGPTDNGQAILEALERANLFLIPLDEERRWYRYHHLFADLLRQRLRQEHPDWVPTLHDRASTWFEQKGLLDESIEHALRAEDFERAASLIESEAETMWGRDEHAKLRRWLERLPAELVLSNPQLCIYYASYLFASGQQVEAERRLQAAEEMLDIGNDHPDRSSLVQQDQAVDTERMKLLGRIAAARSFMASYRSDAAGVIPHARRALEYLPEEDVTWRASAAITLGDAYIYRGRYVEAHRIYLEALEATKATGKIYLIVNFGMKLALCLRSLGRLQETIEICQQRLQLATERGLSETEIVGWLLAILGDTLAEVGDLDRALDHARKGVALTEHGKDVAMLTWSYLCLARVLFSRRDLPGAEKIVMDTAEIARESTVPLWVTNQMAAWQVRIWLAQNRLDEALQWMRKRKLDPDAEPTYVGALEYVALARILVAKERHDDAARLLQRLLAAAESGGHTSRAIELLNIQALAYQARGNTAQAMTVLERALALAEPGGFIHTFVDEGLPMARLLRETCRKGVAVEYIALILAAFETTDDGPQTTQTTIGPSSTIASTLARRPSSALVEPLSERELEVLQLIAEGLTNQEIASRLFLALNTVKSHTRNIYGKLAVHSRTQAVVRARVLGILPFA